MFKNFDWFVCSEIERDIKSGSIEIARFVAVVDELWSKKCYFDLFYLNL